ncbi:MAG TPA: hypothetical protein VFE32_14215 [Puia sp.]|jgi:hypothetical protein|nr:hypothetical protein [Puia sp.]
MKYIFTILLFISSTKAVRSQQVESIHFIYHGDYNRPHRGTLAVCVGSLRQPYDRGLVDSIAGAVVLTDDSTFEALKQFILTSPLLDSIPDYLPAEHDVDYPYYMEILDSPYLHKFLYVANWNPFFPSLSTYLEEKHYDQKVSSLFKHPADWTTTLSKNEVDKAFNRQMELIFSELKQANTKTNSDSSSSTCIRFIYWGLDGYSYPSLEIRLAPLGQPRDKKPFDSLSSYSVLTDEKTFNLIKLFVTDGELINDNRLGILNEKPDLIQTRPGYLIIGTGFGNKYLPQTYWNRFFNILQSQMTKLSLDKRMIEIFANPYKWPQKLVDVRTIQFVYIGPEKGDHESVWITSAAFQNEFQRNADSLHEKGYYTDQKTIDTLRSYIARSNYVSQSYDSKIRKIEPDTLALLDAYKITGVAPYPLFTSGYDCYTLIMSTMQYLVNVGLSTSIGLNAMMHLMFLCHEEFLHRDEYYIPMEPIQDPYHILKN